MGIFNLLFTPKIEKTLTNDQIQIKKNRLQEIEKQLADAQSKMLTGSHTWEQQSKIVLDLKTEEDALQKEIGPYIKEAA